MRKIKRSSDALKYLVKVEKEIETYTYCDLFDYEYLNFLINNVEAVKKAAISVSTFKGQTKRALQTPIGRRAVSTLNTARFRSERD
jgi:hypothetical protein